VEPITLNFYTDDDEIETTHSRSRIPTFLLDSAIQVQSGLESMKDKNEATGEQLNLLYQFIVDFYGNKFTVDDLKRKTDLVECMSIVGQVLGRANQLARQFAGNPTLPSRKRK
jgi:hypothetical protein